MLLSYTIQTKLQYINIIFYSIVYALGMSLILIGTSFGVVMFKQSINKFISRISRSVEQIGIILMIIAGLFITHYWLLGTGSIIFYDSLKELF